MKHDLLVETFYVLAQSDFALLGFSQLFESHALKAGWNEIKISEIQALTNCIRAYVTYSKS